MIWLYICLGNIVLSGYLFLILLEYSCFIILNDILQRAEIFYFDEVQCIFSSFVLLVSYLRNLCLCQGHSIFSLEDLWLQFIRVELISVCEVRRVKVTFSKIKIQPFQKPFSLKVKKERVLEIRTMLSYYIS